MRTKALMLSLALLASVGAFLPTASAGPGCLVGPGCLLPTYDCVDGVQDCDGPPPEAPPCLMGDDEGCLIQIHCPWDCENPPGEDDGDAPPCVTGHEDRCWIQMVVCVTDPCPPRFGGPLEPLNRLP